MKIKELIEGFWDSFAKASRPGAEEEFGKQLAKKMFQPKPLAQKTKDKIQDPKDKIQDPKDKIQDIQPTDIPEPDKPTGNPNANLDSKISYAKSKGWVGQRPTNQEKNYLDTVEVYVDPNMLKNVPAEKNFVPHTPPHEKISMGSFKAPTADINRALGFKGQEQITGFSSFVLTPAGWYSRTRQAYVNPNSKAQDIIDMFWEKSQGGKR